jgi:hypothetical protein
MLEKITTTTGVHQLEMLPHHLIPTDTEPIALEVTQALKESVLHQTPVGLHAEVAPLLVAPPSILTHAVTSWLVQQTLLVALLNVAEHLVLSATVGVVVVDKLGSTQSLLHGETLILLESSPLETVELAAIQLDLPVINLLPLVLDQSQALTHSQHSPVLDPAQVVPSSQMLLLQVLALHLLLI